LAINERSTREEEAPLREACTERKCYPFRGLFDTYQDNKYNLFTFSI